MNTVKDLAIKWWLNLDEQECHNFRIKYPDFNSEGIFYQEVIVKWYVGKFGKVEFDYNEKEIRNIYLKEHTKEQPQSVEDNVWDEELINKFFYYLKYDKGVDTLEDSFMNDFKQHYSLIKK